MGSASSTRRMKKVIKRYEDTILDLDELVFAYAEDMWLKTKPVGSPGMNNITFEFDWSGSRITTGALKLVHQKPSVNPDGEMTKMLKIHKSIHINETESEQEYTITDSRVTTSLVEVRISSGFIHSHGVEIELPNAKDTGLTSPLRICQKHGIQTREESMTWTIGSKIKAKPMRKVKVVMTLKETQFSTDFQLPVTLKGKVVINVFEKQSYKFLMKIEGHIHEIVKFENGKGLKGWDHPKEDKTACCTIEGNLFMRYQVDKREQVTEMELSDNEDDDSAQSQVNRSHRRMASSGDLLSRQAERQEQPQSAAKSSWTLWPFGS